MAALGGAPGVISARYAGHEGDDVANNARLLAELRALPGEHERSARFVCVIAYPSHRTRPPPMSCAASGQA